MRAEECHVSICRLQNKNKTKQNSNQKKKKNCAFFILPLWQLTVQDLKVMKKKKKANEKHSSTNRKRKETTEGVSQFLSTDQNSQKKKKEREGNRTKVNCEMEHRKEIKQTKKKKQRRELQLIAPVTVSLNTNK